MIYLCRKAAEFFDDEQLDLEVPVDRLSLSQELQDMLEARVKTLNNLAICQIKVEAWDSAMETLKHVLKIEVSAEDLMMYLRYNDCCSLAKQREGAVPQVKSPPREAQV